MGKDGDAKLGEQVLVQAIVGTVGTHRSMLKASMFGGAAGVVAGSAMGKLGTRNELLNFNGRMYALLGPTRLGFFRLDSGWFRGVIGPPLGILRRDAVASITVGSGVLSIKVTVSIDDGTSLELEAPGCRRAKSARWPTSSTATATVVSRGDDAAIRGHVTQRSIRSAERPVRPCQRSMTTWQ